jgi:hypothetical protein
MKTGRLSEIHPVLQEAGEGKEKARTEHPRRKT